MTSGLDNAMRELHEFDALAARDQWMNRIHPLAKLAVTVFYIAVTVSFRKYDLAGLLGMAVYPAAGMMLAELSPADALRRLKPVFLFLLVLGLANPVFDRTPLQLGAWTVRGGVVSMATLMLKGFFSVLAAYILAASTPAAKLCRSLEMLHVPGIMVTQIMLMYRYIYLFIGEAGRITQAYSLRAPGQKGIHFSAWGSLAGMMLLRSIDRASLVYESMQLRGFDGSFVYSGQTRGICGTDIAYMAFWAALFVLCRKIPVILAAGNLAASLLR